MSSFYIITLPTSLMPCFLCLFHHLNIFGLVLPFLHRLTSAENYEDIIHLYPSSQDLITKLTAKTLETSYILRKRLKRISNESWHEKLSASGEKIFPTKVLTDETINVQSSFDGTFSSNVLYSPCCTVPAKTIDSMHLSEKLTTEYPNDTLTNDPREITNNGNTSSSEMVNNIAQHNAAVVVGIVFGAIAAVLFIGAISLIYVYLKRRLSHNTTSKTDLSSILEDHMTMSYIETRYDRQRNMSDEVISLDNDSFLQSLETTSLSYLPTPNKSA